jgi:DNA-directed RNA polymerase subunit RPC12/RpoP
MSEIIIYKCEHCKKEFRKQKLHMATDAVFFNNEKIEGDYDFCNEKCFFAWLTKFLQDTVYKKANCKHTFMDRPSLCSQCGTWNPEQPKE